MNSIAATEPDNGFYGYLIVVASTGRGAFPIEGALVTITSSDGAQSNIIGTFHTGADGRTPKIRLAAPDNSNTRRPTEPGALRSFAQYNIDTDAKGYYSVRNINAPIFADVTSIQPVELVPLSAELPSELYPGDEIRYNESVTPGL